MRGANHRPGKHTALEQGGNCLYVTFQDTEAQLLDMAAGFGWDLRSAQAAGRLMISHVPMGDLDLDVLASGVRAQLAGHQVSRIVIDSLAELVMANRESERFPAYKRSLLGLIRAAGASLLVTSETTSRGLRASALEMLMFLFDNVIDLRYVEEGSQLGRALNIVKMRGGMHEMTLNAVTIGEHGLVVGAKLEGVTGRTGWSALRSDHETPALIPAAP